MKMEIQIIRSENTRQWTQVGKSCNKISLRNKNQLIFPCVSCLLHRPDQGVYNYIVTYSLFDLSWLGEV